MQVLPILGSAALMAAAGYAVSLALHSTAPEIPVIRASQNAAPQGNTARQIKLAPNPRQDTFFAAITDRPLFSETRRPVVEQAAPAPEPEVEIAAPAAAPPSESAVPDAVLLGVLTGGARTAALLSIAGADPEWLSQGARIDSWTLAEVGSNSVLFKENEREHRVELYQR
ncbi:MAG: hypothetical protein AAFN94_12545 [Pseudomonadota bacterium]